AIKLIAGENQYFVWVLALDVRNVLPHRVGRALIPVSRLVSLLGREHLDEAVAEHVELVRVRDVPVQADAEELRQNVNAVQPTIDAVRDRDIDEAILARDRHGRLRPGLREREETGTSPATQDDG